MAISTRLIRRRIKSITNTRKITKAMELVAAAKMRKAIAAVLASRPYSQSTWRAVEEIARTSDPGLHPLLQPGKPTGRELMILFSSDRGLCGGVNSRLLKSVFEFAAGRQLDFAVIGRKGLQAIHRRGDKIIAAFNDLSTNPGIADVMQVGRLAMDDFSGGQYQSVWLAYTDYKSSLNQIPVVRQLLPLVGRLEGLGDIGQKQDEHGGGETFAPNRREYLFEPSPEKVLAALLPRIVETQIYQALLESLASEHSARMMAMRSASDNASDMLDSLTLTLNQARQAGITMEIAEISSGKAALEKNR